MKVMPKQATQAPAIISSGVTPSAFIPGIRTSWS
jgi:hypothetical protein